MTALTIVSVFPELFGTYGDVGNVLVLERRLAWRGIPVEVVPVSVAQPFPTSGDLYVFGGSEDEAQERALVALRSSHLSQTVEAGAHLFGVCAGLQVLGRTFQGGDGEVHEGMGLLDATTTRLDRRVVGEVVAVFNEQIGLPRLTGFANHGGGTELGPGASPLAKTVAGRGNDGLPGGRVEAVLGAQIRILQQRAPWWHQQASGLTHVRLLCGRRDESEQQVGVLLAEGRDRIAVGKEDRVVAETLLP